MYSLIDAGTSAILGRSASHSENNQPFRFRFLLSLFGLWKPGGKPHNLNLSSEEALTTVYGPTDGHILLFHNKQRLTFVGQHGLVCSDKEIQTDRDG